MNSDARKLIFRNIHDKILRSPEMLEKRFLIAEYIRQELHE
jgi:hypothetical protein